MFEWLWDVLMHLLLVFYLTLMVVVAWLRFGILSFINSRTLPPHRDGMRRTTDSRKRTAQSGFAPAQKHEWAI